MTQRKVGKGAVFRHRRAVEHAHIADFKQGIYRAACRKERREIDDDLVLPCRKGKLLHRPSVDRESEGALDQLSLAAIPGMGTGIKIRAYPVLPADKSCKENVVFVVRALVKQQSDRIFRALFQGDRAE